MNYNNNKTGVFYSLFLRSDGGKQRFQDQAKVRNPIFASVVQGRILLNTEKIFRQNILLCLNRRASKKDWLR